MKGSRVMKIMAVVCAVVFALSLGVGTVCAAAGLDRGLAELMQILNGEIPQEWRTPMGGSLRARMDRPGLEIRAEEASVTVQRVEREDILVEYTASGLSGIRNWEPVTLTERDNKVVVSAADSAPFPWWRDMQITVSLPEGYRGDLELHIDGGAIRLLGNQQFRRVETRIGSGFLYLEDCTAENLEANLYGGELEIGRLDAALELENNYGKAEVRALAGGASISQQGGSLDLAVEKLSGPIRLDMQDSEAALALPKDAAATVYLLAEDGKLDQRCASFDGLSNSAVVQGILNGGGESISGEITRGTLTIRDKVA